MLLLTGVTLHSLLRVIVKVITKIVDKINECRRKRSEGLQIQEDKDMMSLLDSNVNSS
jgi:hypothetical protein